MKIGNLPNYVVQVYRTADGEEPARAELYEGMYTVALNLFVHIRFVPFVDQNPPPWPPDRDPPAADRVTSAAQVRWTELVLGDYTVTPNAAKAGQTDQFGQDDLVSTVFYVTPAEFDVFSGELRELADLTGSSNTRLHRDDVLGRSVMRYIDEHVLDSPLLHPLSAEVVARQPNRAE